MSRPLIKLVLSLPELILFLTQLFKKNCSNFLRLLGLRIRYCSELDIASVHNELDIQLDIASVHNGAPRALKCSCCFRNV